MLKVLIRGLKKDITEDELTGELILKAMKSELFIKFLKVGRKLHFHMVTLPNSLVSKAIFKETALFYISIKVEAYRTINPTNASTASCFAI